MIDLNTFYISQKYVGPSGSQPSVGGFVPTATNSDTRKFLRGDGTWSDNSSAIQYITNNNNIILNVANHDTFVINLTGSSIFAYSGFENGKSINVYLVGNHTGSLAHTFPINTVFPEISGSYQNTIYSFQGYTTKILCQNVGGSVLSLTSTLYGLLSGSSSSSSSSSSSRSSSSSSSRHNNLGVSLLDVYLDILDISPI